MTKRERYVKAAKAGAAAVQKFSPGHPAVQLLMDLAARFSVQPVYDLVAAKSPKSSFATQKEEITRKALGAVADAQAKFEAGIITGRDLWVAVDAIHDTVSGVIDPDMTLLIYRARQELQEHAPQ